MALIFKELRSQGMEEIRSEKRNKQKRIIIMFIIMVLLVATFLINCSANQGLTAIKHPKINVISEESQEDIYNQAVNYFIKKYPEFIPENDRTYITQNKESPNEWYIYIFDKRDKGLGYEIYYENGKMTDNYNKELFEKRLELIDFMNRLMPENKQFNEYVGFNPYGSDEAKTYTEIGVNDGRVEYVVVAHHIDIEKQLEIDYQVLKKANELLKGLSVQSNGNWVRYIEADEIDINQIIKRYKYSYENTKRQRDRSSFLTSTLGDLSDEYRMAYENGELSYSLFQDNISEDTQINCISDYRIGKFDDKEKTDMKRQELLDSLTGYKIALKSLLDSSSERSKEANKQLLDELLKDEVEQ